MDAKHETWMREAMKEAKKAIAHGDVPVGAVVIHEDRIIASRHNEREHLQNPTAHAEILALSDAARALGSWRLLDVSLVVTLEPCAMCAGAATSARVGEVIFGAYDPKGGACGSLYNLGTDVRLNHAFEITGAVLEAECGELLTQFFSSKRV